MAKPKAPLARDGTPVWLPKDVVRMAKIVAAFRGESSGSVIARHAQRGLLKEFSQAVRGETSLAK